jgi:formylglycine-generating enzyme required for sulfatase activity
LFDARRHLRLLWSYEGGTCKYREARGGAWFGFPDLIRSAYRYPYATDYRESILGFWVGRTLIAP